MNGNAKSANARIRCRRMIRPFAGLLIGAAFIGPCFDKPALCHTKTDAAPTAPAEISEGFTMETKKSSPVHRTVQTPSGLIGYTEQGSGPVALFVHGVLLNGHLWRHQLADLSDIRRCIAVDLLAHGDTEIAPDQDVSVTANAKMLNEFLDALHIDQVDLVGNDSGGGISQIFAALYPQRVRSLTLTDCDTHDNWPPEAFKPFLAMAAGGGLRGTLDAMLSDKTIYRWPQVLGPAYERSSFGRQTTSISMSNGRTGLATTSPAPAAVSNSRVPESSSPKNAGRTLTTNSAHTGNWQGKPLTESCTVATGKEQARVVPGPSRILDCKRGQVMCLGVVLLPEPLLPLVVVALQRPFPRKQNKHRRCGTS